jgi:hydroxyethylthiazole kinase
MKPSAFYLLERIRQQRPVIHHLTNWVTIYDCAQILKTIGASPVMAHAREEVADMVQIASALVLNIGTLTVDFVEAMKLAVQGANKQGIPVILDICGAGATGLRDRKCFELLSEGRIDVIKGNASEIARICGESVRTKGVDATAVACDLGVLARQLAQQRDATVVITGREDIVTDGTQFFTVANGHEMMTRIVGTGCMATSVIGACAAVERDTCLAAASALACYGIAGELAAQKAIGPATFKANLFDCLYTLDHATVERMQRINGG